MPSLNRALILVADDRASGRYRLLLQANSSGTGAGKPVTLHDLSQSGLLFEAEAGIESDAEIMLDIPAVGHVIARTVWTNGRFYGAQLVTPLARDQLKAALAQSKIVWPEFRPAAPNIEQARSRRIAPTWEGPGQDDQVPPPGLNKAEPDPERDLAEHAEPIGNEPKLPFPVRVRIIVGLTLALWSFILGLLRLAFG